MSQTLKNKIAVVTGASRGIGRATALRLAQEGAEVFVHYSASKDAADSLVKEIAGFGGKAHAVHADLNENQGAEKLASQIPGTIDILVNNAGVAEYVSFEDTTPEQFDSCSTSMSRACTLSRRSWRRRSRTGAGSSISRAWWHG